MLLHNRTVLFEKLKESLMSVLPITGIVFILCFSIIPVPNDILMAFVIGAIMLILGMGFFTLGTDLAMTPIGEGVGSTVVKSKRLWLIILTCFLVGMIVTVSEPDLQVLAQQVPNIPNLTIILAVATGVGVFLVVAVLRIFFRIRLSHLLIVLYLITFTLAFFVPKEFLAIAFDSGGVTTGPMTVPFIMALGIGIASIRADKNAENDSFGLVALCSVGPILTVMILGLLYNPGESVYTPVTIPALATSRDLWKMFVDAFPSYLKEVGLALLPIVIFYFLFELLKSKINHTRLGGRGKKSTLIRICFGLVYTYVGLVLFLTGVNVGFMPVGNFLGQQLGGLERNWIIIPIGMIIGYFIVMAEPAVHVLNKQVFEMTSGMIPQKAMSTSLSIGVAISVGLSMLRIITGLPILYLLIPGYLLAIVLSFLVSPIFTAIAFDSGGVASGPMTATFLLPLAMGACKACGGNVVIDAFGVVAMVAMTPLITIQILGLIFRIKAKAKSKQKAQTTNSLQAEDTIIQAEVDHESDEIIH